MIRMTFQSGLKEKEKQFVAFKQQFGHTYEARIYNLLDFDRFCAANYPGRDTLDQDIVLEWAVIRPTETANGFATRISAVRQFGKYLAMIGEDAYIIPDGFRGGDMPLMPYIFSETSLRQFLGYTDSMERYCQSAVRHLVAPAMFRFMYCCGLRPCEARNLDRADVYKRQGYYNPSSIENALEMLNLADAGKKPVRSYSLGMKQRLGIARAILSKPELLILDEPTNGLDPAGMKQIRDLLKMLCTEYGITIVVSSHILSEIESIADTIGVINHGALIKEVTMKEISEMSLAYIELSVINIKKASYVLADKMGLDNFKIVEDGKIRIYDHHISTQELSRVLALNDVEIVAIGKKAETLEDYFLKMTAEV